MIYVMNVITKCVHIVARVIRAILFKQRIKIKKGDGKNQQMESWG